MVGFFGFFPVFLWTMTVLIIVSGLIITICFMCQEFNETNNKFFCLYVSCVPCLLITGYE